MNILVLGSGGREHAIAWALAQSRHRPSLFIAPGNAGTSTLGTNVDLAVTDIDGLLAFAGEHDIDLTIVGPEQPLVDGVVDRFREAGRKIVGPTAAAAQLEGSKAFAKAFMRRHGIPTAAYETFTSAGDALAYLGTQSAPIVVKASGLAAGKGAVVCMTMEEARAAVREMLEDHRFGEAGAEVVIEAFMQGEEASVFAVCDGRSYRLLPAAQDHKRIGEGDTGPNTGGMGAYAPAPVVTPEVLQRVEETIIEPTLAGMEAEGAPYTGFLYVGLMIEAGQPRVVEFNCRLGDPETQVLLPLLEVDFVDFMQATASGTLDSVDVSFTPGAAACVVMASAGYPGAYEKGKTITGVENVSDALVFEAGTRRNGAELQTNGGRVLAVTGQGASLQQALGRAYAGIDAIHFDGAYVRRDIGQKGL